MWLSEEYIFIYKKVGDGEISVRVRAFDGIDYSDILTWNVDVKNKNEDDETGFRDVIAGILVGLLFILIACLFIPWKKLLKEDKETEEKEEKS